MLKKRNLESNKGIALIVLLIIINILVAAVIVIVTLCLKGKAEKTNLADDSLSIKKEKTEWVETKKPTEWGTNNNVKAMSNGTDIIPLPTGYTISTNEGENEIKKGLVIKDSNNNEFVWIPVSNDFDKTYTRDSEIVEPKELINTNDSDYIFTYTDDSQVKLDKYYGIGYYHYPETEQEKTNIDNKFAYIPHYEEMVDSVNKYNGFYVGRYETTIDEEGNIGSKVNTKVLTASDTLFTDEDGTIYPYRWWGLYDAQRNNDSIIGNNDYVQTNMMSGQQWDAMLIFIGEEDADSMISGTQESVLKSAEAIYDKNEKDIMKNIYDLRRNVREFTGEANVQIRSARDAWSDSTNFIQSMLRILILGLHIVRMIIVGSRISLYIK